MWFNHRGSCNAATRDLFQFIHPSFLQIAFLATGEDVKRRAQPTLETLKPCWGSHVLNCCVLMLAPELLSSSASIYLHHKTPHHLTELILLIESHAASTSISIRGRVVPSLSQQQGECQQALLYSQNVITVLHQQPAFPPSLPLRCVETPGAL